MGRRPVVGCLSGTEAATELLERVRAKAAIQAAELGGDPAKTEAPAWIPSAREVLGYDTLEFSGPDLLDVRFVRTPRFVPPAKMLDAALLSRVPTVAQRPRERRERRTSRSVGSRGDPSEPGDDDPEPLIASLPLRGGA